MVSSHVYTYSYWPYLHRQGHWEVFIIEPTKFSEAEPSDHNISDLTFSSISGHKDKLQILRQNILINICSQNIFSRTY